MTPLALSAIYKGELTACGSVDGPKGQWAWELGIMLTFEKSGGMVIRSALAALIMILPSSCFSRIMPSGCLASNGFCTASCTCSHLDRDLINIDNNHNMNLLI